MKTTAEMIEVPPVRIEAKIGPLHVLLYAMSFCGGAAFCLLVMGSV